LSQQFPSSGWHPGPSNVGQNALKPTSLMMSPTKKTKSKTFHVL